MGELARLPFTTAEHWRHFRPSAAGLAVVGEPSFDDWSAALADLKRVGVSLMWLVGDLLNYGADRWGEDSSQVLDAADYADGSLRVAGWVARKFPPAIRVTSLPFRHHQEVAALETPQAVALLAHAEAAGLSSRDLRKLVNEVTFTPAAFDRAAAVDALEGWLRRRRDDWPADERDGFAAALRGIAGRMESDHG